MLRLEAVVLALALVTSCGALQGVLDTLRDHNQTQAAALLEEAISQGLLDLSTGGPYTLFMPTDDAFSKLSSEELASLTTDSNAFSDLLQYHVVQGEVFSWAMVSGRVLNTVNGHAIRVYTSGQSVYVNDARLETVDVEANNAVIHFIDTVLDVPLGTIYNILKDGNFSLSTFAEYVDRAGFHSTLANVGRQKYTVFAPSDDAFARLSSFIHDRIRSSSRYLRELVAYHIHQGTLHVASLDRNGTISTVDNYHEITISVDTDIHLNNVAYLEETDLDADNGVVHIIDHVLIPSSLGSIIG